MRWVLENAAPCAPEVAQAIRAFRLHPTIQQLLQRIPFISVDELQRFLNPSLKDVEAPETIQHLEEVVAVVDAACRQKKVIAVVSDYDVDGITSLALLQRFFRQLHHTFYHFFPNRETEGYGLTEKVVRRILQEQQPMDLLIALDCGTNSLEAIQLLKQAKIQTIVIDHHQKSRETLPDALIVNPHLDEAAHSASAQSLCSAGLVFKFIYAWVKLLRKRGDPSVSDLKLRPYLDLVALGTIADMVPLREENRLWVHFGLRELPRHNLGLKKLLQVSGCPSDAPITTEDVSFKIAPRINVSGRLESAEIPYQLLSSEDAFLCDTYAQKLNQLNAERQAIEHQLTQEADVMIALHPEKKAHVLFQPHWHIGVVGIVAGKLTRKWHRPVLVLGNRDGICKGSGRSIPEINLVPMFLQAQALLEQWGGHPAAVGLSVTPENRAALEASFNAYLDRLFPQNLPEPVLSLSATLTLEGITPAFLSELERLSPFGQGNEAPIFLLQNVRLPASLERFGRHRAHLRFLLNKMEVIGWHMGQMALEPHQWVDLAVRIPDATVQPLRLQLVAVRPANFVEKCDKTFDSGVEN